MEGTIRERIDMVQKNNEMKVLVLEEKIKYLEGLSESAATNRKKYADEREEVNEEISAIKKDLRRKLADLESRFNE
jgi:hypothetical protein